MAHENLEQKIDEDLKRLRAPEGYLWAGLPRFRRLFGRDSCISAWQLLDKDPNIAKHTLFALAARQGKQVHALREEEPGKIVHECPVTVLDTAHMYLKKKFRWRFPYYGGVDSTAWFIILLGMYAKKTGDLELARTLWPNVLRALEWMRCYGDVDGDELIEYERKNPHGLFHQGWKDASDMKVVKVDPPIAVVEVQGYSYLALSTARELSLKLFGKSEDAEELARKSHALKRRFNASFWMPNEHYFAFALDRKKQQMRSITSNPGHLLFTGILDPAHASLVVRRLFAPDLWTPYGIRVLSTHDPLFDPENYHRGSVWPHDNWVIYQGLKKLGYRKEAERIKRALLDAVRTLEHIPELYSVRDKTIRVIPKSCTVQAWSCGAIWNLLNTQDNKKPPLK